MHSHKIKIEMCNACVHWLAQRDEERFLKRSPLSQPANVCFLNVAFSPFLLVPICFYRPFLSFFCFSCVVAGRKGLVGRGAGREDDFSILVAVQGRRSSLPAAYSLRCVCFQRDVGVGYVCAIFFFACLSSGFFGPFFFSPATT